jgi:hypothetical protein
LYNSNISARKLIENIAEEADVTISVDSDSWYRWINAVEQFVYTEIFNQHTVKVFNYSEIANDTISLSDGFSVNDGIAVPDFDDVVKVYADDVELERTGVVAAFVFVDKPLYYTDYNGNIVIKPCFPAKNITVIYRIRPEIKDETTDNNINLPIEFVDMLAARMRAEAYKLSNDDAQGAKWMADYNTQLEMLKVWASMRNNKYGE